MLLNLFYSSILLSSFLLEIESFFGASSTDIFTFIVVSILIITLFYSFVTLNNQHKLIEEQNAEILNKNDQLQNQNIKLQKINDEKSNLIGIVSHDLKSPFNRLFALLNLLKMTSNEITEDQEEYLSKMHQVIKDGMALITNLLDIRAIEDEGIKMVIEEVDVLRIVKESLKAHRPLADIKEIKLKLIKEVDEVLIISDKLYLSRILDNLLSNALKFSEKETVVKVKVVIDTQHVTVTVSDQGPGLSEDDQEKIFQKFQVLSARPTDGESSTGLGLNIVKSLVDNLEGSIICKSEIGEGASFIVILPLEIDRID